MSETVGAIVKIQDGLLVVKSHQTEVVLLISPLYIFISTTQSKGK